MVFTSTTEQPGYWCKSMTDIKMRAAVSALEASIVEGIASGDFVDAMDQCPVVHHFAPTIEEYGCGTYARELTMPKGATIVGKLHRHSHLAFLLKGKVAVVSEFGKEIMEAPHTFLSPLGAKRAFHALEDSILTTIHLTKHTQEEALEDIEDEVISETYTALGMEEPDMKMFYKELEKIQWHG